MAEREEQFKTSIMGGFDKQDVDERFRQMREEASAEREKLTAAVKEREAEAAELNASVQELADSLARKEAEAETLRSNIDGKYKSYIDNYDMIGKLANESRMRADEIRKTADEERVSLLEEAGAEAQRIREDAEADAKTIREDAEADAKRALEEARNSVDEEQTEGQARYEAAQEELTDVVELFNRVQRQFRLSYRSIQEIANR